MQRVLRSHQLWHCSGIGAVANWRAELKRMPIVISQRFGDRLLLIIVMLSEPNQSSEPTTTSVTICAEPQIAPAAVVAHL